jgi:hypothetical protein
MNLATVGSIVVIDDNHLTFVMPNKTGDYAGPGPWTDTVVAEIATPPTNAGIPFTFDAFAIQTISPDHTAAAGGTTITLSGTGLDETTILYVDGSSTAFAIVDQHTVTFVAPAHAAGIVVVDLTGSVSPDTMINLTYV